MEGFPEGQGECVFVVQAALRHKHAGVRCSRSLERRPPGATGEGGRERTRRERSGNARAAGRADGAGGG